jgi:hypothetical protein
MLKLMLKWAHIKRINDKGKKKDRIEVTFVLFYLSRAHDILCRDHEILSRAQEIIKWCARYIMSWPRLVKLCARDN